MFPKFVAHATAHRLYWLKTSACQMLRVSLLPKLLEWCRFDFSALSFRSHSRHPSTQFNLNKRKCIHVFRRVQILNFTHLIGIYVHACIPTLMSSRGIFSLPSSSPSSVSSSFSYNSLTASVSVSFCLLSLHFVPCALVLALSHWHSCFLVLSVSFACSLVLMFSCCMVVRLFSASFSSSSPYLSCSVACCSHLDLPLAPHHPIPHTTWENDLNPPPRFTPFSTSLSRECAMCLRGGHPCQANSDNSSLSSQTHHCDCDAAATFQFSHPRLHRGHSHAYCCRCKAYE